MDAFEKIVAQLLKEDGYWVQQEVKVDLNKSEKRKIGKPTMPRPEIDIIAFKKNKLYLLEVKSFLDSYGVNLNDVKKQYKIPKGRYKLLTSKKYSSIIAKTLATSLIKKGLINKDTKILFGLIAGNVNQKEDEFKEWFKKNEWLFWAPSEIQKKVNALAEKGYENNSVTIASKILQKDFGKAITKETMVGKGLGVRRHK